MANLFINIPVPPANGSGAPVDVSAMGPSKTISVTGLFVAFVTIEISNEIVPTMWAPLITFGNPDGIVFDVACRWMRVSVAGYKSGAPQCDVGGTDDGTVFATLPVPAGNGAGAAVNTSLLPLFKTVTVGGPFGGTVQIEVSEDGVGNWSQLGFGFPNAGQQSQVMAAQWMRAVRAGVPQIAPGLPIVNVGACSLGGGGVGPPGPPGASINCLIYRPGSGLAGPVVFDDWNVLYAALQTDRLAANGSGCYTIAFDDSIVSPCPIPVGAYDMTGVMWEGYSLIANNVNVAVSIPEGVTFTKLRSLQNSLFVTFTGTTPPVADFAANEVFAMGGGAGILATGAGPFIRNAAPSFVVLGVDRGCVVGDGGTPVVDVAAGSVLLITMTGSFGQVQPDSVSGAPGSTLIILAGSSGLQLASETQPAFLGTIIPQNQTKWRINPFPEPPAGPITVDTILTDANTLALVDASALPVQITLPLAASTSPNRGQTVIVKSVAATGTINIVTQGGNLIDGAASLALTAPYGAMFFQSDGVSQWRRVGSFNANAASAPSIIVYAPGMVAPTAPYYNNWADVETAVNALEGACQLWVDQTGFGGYAPVPATANLDGKGRLEIIGKGPGGEAGLTFADGAQIRNVQGFRTIVLRGQSNTIPPLLWDLDGMICELYDATFLFAGVCTQPVMQISVPSYISFFGGNSTELRNGGNPGAAVMNINAPALVFLALDTLFFPSPFVDTISGAVGSTLEVQTDASFPPVITIPAFLGTFTQVCIDILVRNTMALPEQWAVDNVPANTPTTPMSAQVSTNFDTIKMMRPGSVVGMSTRLTEAITAGTLQAELTVNGVVNPTLAVVMGIGSTGGQTTRLPGVIPYVAGDLIGVNFVTSVGFTPITTDLEAWLEVVEDWNQ